MNLKTKEKHKNNESCSCGQDCGAEHSHENPAHGHSHKHEDTHNHKESHAEHSHSEHDECDEEHGCGCGHEHGKPMFPLNRAVFFVGFILLALTFLPQIPEIVGIVVSVALYIYFGLPIIINMIKEIAHGEIFNENTLMTVASIGAMCIGEFHDAAAVVFLYSFGEYLQDKAFSKSKKSISDMLVKNPEAATVMRGNEQIKVNINEVKVGEEIIVKTGEKIPLDGIVTGGSAFADSSAITGESVPLTLDAGAEAISGCILTNGSVTVKTTKPYSESTVSLVMKAVEEANKRKSPTEKFILKFSRIYTPVVSVLAVIIVLANIFILKSDIVPSVKTGLIFLVVSCPCALVLSVPLSYFAGIGALSKKGILIKGGSAIDNTVKINTVVFDKTGTITENNLSVDSVHSQYGSTEEFEHLTASLMKNSNHPLCKAYASKVKSPLKTESFTEIAGYGVKGVVNGKNVLCGNKALMEKNGVNLNEEKGTLVYCAINGEYRGYIKYKEIIKKGAFSVIEKLKKLSVKDIFLMSGDKKDSVLEISGKVGIKNIFAELKPHEKMQKLDEIILKNKGGKVMFVGDGLNDSAVLARSDIGVAMAASGSSMVINASDAAIIDDDVKKVSDIISIGRKTKAIVVQNIVFALSSKLAIMLISAFLYQSMELAIIADVGVALLCVLNSLRVLAVQ